MTFRLCLQLWVVLAALTLISTTGAEALAASNILHPTNFQDASLRLLGESAQVTSWWATRFYPGKPQTHEFSCGPAALANLLSVFFGLAVDEAAIIQDGIEQDRGVSLHYLLESARSLGFQAAVYRMDAGVLLRILQEVGVPVIGVLVEPVSHFIIAIAQVTDGLLIFDPGVGFTAISLRQLCERWSGYALVVDPGSQHITMCKAMAALLANRSEARSQLLSQLSRFAP